MMKKLHLNIVSPEKELFNGEVESVTLPGTMGSFSILPQHAPIVSSLGTGKLGQIHLLSLPNTWSGRATKSCVKGQRSR